MADDTYTTEVELASYLRVDIATGTAQLYVDLANGLIVDLIGVLDPIPTKARAIALEAAARGYRNPQGYTSETKKIDDFTHTSRREGDNATRAGVYLTPAEERTLLRLAGHGGRGIGSIRLRVPLT